MKSFKKFFENRDIFGFLPEKSIAKKDDLGDKPIQTVRTNFVIDLIKEYQINNKLGFSRWCNEAQWGETTGAWKVVITPIGSSRAIVKRLGYDLEGNPTWFCKSVLPLANSDYGKDSIDENYALDLLHKMEVLDLEEIDSPSSQYNLEPLVLAIAKKVAYERTDIFIFEGIRRDNDSHYLIHFNTRGQGVGAPGSARVEQFIIDVSHSSKTGLIRCFGNDIQSPLKQHLWMPQPCEWDENFMVTQPQEEIVEAIYQSFATY